MPSQLVVLDTNIVLDVFVFNNPAAKAIRQALIDGYGDGDGDGFGELTWLATDPMRAELARVLAYPKIIQRLAFYALTMDAVLSQFDQHAKLVDVAPKASLTCKDADDQKFIDLAVQHRAWLISKDQHVLSMKKRLLAQGIRAQAAI